MVEGIDAAAVNNVNEAEENIETQVDGMDGEAGAGDILEATCSINNSTNQASASTAATQKQDQMEQAAIGTLR